MSDDTPKFDLSLMGSADPIVALVYNDAIRRAEIDGTNYYSLVDFASYFSDSTDDPRRYWFNVKRSMIKEGFEPSSEIRQIKLRAPDGKMRLTDCGDIVTIRRVIMSLPSEKAEPLRMWIAGRKETAYLNYDHQNVIEGKAWAADSVREETKDLEPAEPDSPWQELGYIP